MTTRTTFSVLRFLVRESVIRGLPLWGMCGFVTIVAVATSSWIYLAIPASVVFLFAAMICWLLWDDRRQEAAWERRVEAESRAVLDRIAHGEERTYTAAEVREMLRREDPTS